MEKPATPEKPATLEGPILVSACLLGVQSRFDGGSCPREAALDLLRRGIALPVCPEQLGGLPTPRPRAEIRGGDGADVLAGRALVVDEEGRDVTAAFLRGARETVRLAAEAGVKRAVLRSHSPSCGAGAIHDGTFTGRLRLGDGVSAALLRQAGITLTTEEDLW